MAETAFEKLASFHEIWWIARVIDGEGVKGFEFEIAHFHKALNGTEDGALVVVIPRHAASAPKTFGVRIWDTLVERDGWVKVKQIEIPTYADVEAVQGALTEAAERRVQ